MTEEEDFWAEAGEAALRLGEAGEANHDPGFAQARREWEVLLAPLLEEVAEVAPPPLVWARLQAATRPARAQHVLLRGHRWAGLAFLAAAAILVFSLLGPAPSQSTVIASQEGDFAVTLELRTLTLTPEKVRLPAGKSAELWLILPGEKPRGLGLLAVGQNFTTQIPVPQNTPMVLAISLEPPGGSPTGLPTGPVIGEAKLTPS